MGNRVGWAGRPDWRGPKRASTSVVLEQDLMDDLLELARRERRSRGELVREAVRLLLLTRGMAERPAGEQRAAG